jgi:uncharacterized protein YutE (UPF0331/DUF86 family)
MVDRNVIASRIEAIEKHLVRINPYTGISEQEFSTDLDAQDIVEYNLFQIVNHLIDMIQHIVVDENLGFPESAYDAAEILRNKGIISERECDILRRMIGFRDVIGHDYVSVNKRTIYGILTAGPQDIKSIISTITERFL